MQEQKYLLQADRLQTTRIFIAILKQGSANYGLRGRSLLTRGFILSGPPTMYQPFESILHFI